MKVVEVSLETISYIYTFLENPAHISPFFRYFSSRVPEKAIQNHVYTLVGLDENNCVIGYGHIDYEDKNWLGICILEPYKGKGYGTQLLLSLIDFADRNTIELYLTVDKENCVALNLYKKYKFNILKEEETFYQMKRDKEEN